MERALERERRRINQLADIRRNTHMGAQWKAKGKDLAANAKGRAYQHRSDGIRYEVPEYYPGVFRAHDFGYGDKISFF